MSNYYDKLVRRVTEGDVVKVEGEGAHRVIEVHYHFFPGQVIHREGVDPTAELESLREWLGGQPPYPTREEVESAIEQLRSDPDRADVIIAAPPPLLAVQLLLDRVKSFRGLRLLATSPSMSVTRELPGIVMALGGVAVAVAYSLRVFPLVSSVSVGSAYSLDADPTPGASISWEVTLPRLASWREFSDWARQVERHDLIRVLNLRSFTRAHPR